MHRQSCHSWIPHILAHPFQKPKAKTKRSKPPTAPAGYQYTSLDKTSDEIRLVTIRAAKFSADIQCTVSKHVWEEIPPYEALSYAWGNAAETKPISLDGCEVEVTNNLHSALRYQRQEDEDRVMWIDAICINQKNDEEKNHQVGMMKRIYETAEQVVVWLGEGNDIVGVVFEKLEILRTFTDEDVPSITRQDLKDIFGHDALDGLKELLESQWWKRVWVVQEVEVAKRVLVTCGKAQIAGESYDAAIHTIDYINFRHFTTSDTHLSTELLKSGVPLSRDLLYLASEYRDRQSSDKRDKLFALAPISEEIDFTPDYRLSALEVYGTFVAVCIQRSGTLDVLNFSDPVTRDFPSWIPDWSSYTLKVGLIKYESWNSAAQFVASGDSTAQFDAIKAFTSIGGVMPVGGFQEPFPCSVRGFDTDTAFFLSSPMVDRDEIGSRTTPLAQELISIYLEQSNSGGPYKTQEEFWNAFWLTLVADGERRFHGMTRPSRNTEANAVSFSRWMDGSLESEREVLDSSFDFHANFWLAFLKRRFMISRTGYFGLVPDETLPGDLICILFGGQTPFVLRKMEEVSETVRQQSRELGGDGSVYRLIGECYIHGIMDGEAYEEFKRGESDSKEQTFVLL